MLTNALKSVLVLAGYIASLLAIIAPSGGCGHTTSRAPCSHCLMPQTKITKIQKEQKSEEDDEDES